MVLDFWVKKMQKTKNSKCNGSNSPLSVFYTGVVTCVHIIKKFSIGFVHVAVDKR